MQSGMPVLYVFYERQDNIDVVALTVDLSGKSLQKMEKQTSW